MLMPYESLWGCFVRVSPVGQRYRVIHLQHTRLGLFPVSMSPLLCLTPMPSISLANHQRKTSLRSVPPEMGGASPDRTHHGFAHSGGPAWVWETPEIIALFVGVSHLVEWVVRKAMRAYEDVVKRQGRLDV